MIFCAACYCEIGCGERNAHYLNTMVIQNDVDVVEIDRLSFLSGHLNVAVLKFELISLQPLLYQSIQRKLLVSMGARWAREEGMVGLNRKPLDC